MYFLKIVNLMLNIYINRIVINVLGLKLYINAVILLWVIKLVFCYNNGML